MWASDKRMHKSSSISEDIQQNINRNAGKNTCIHAYIHVEVVGFEKSEMGTKNLKHVYC